MEVLITQEPYISYIEDHEKTLDIRIGTDRIKRIKASDIVTFRNRAKSIRRKVVAIRTYPSFEKMLDQERLDKIAPRSPSREAILTGLTDLYAKAVVEKLGVYVLELGRP